MSVRSMTGYARVHRQLASGDLIVSVKSVNHRGLDLHFHLPGEFDALEAEVRTEIKKRVGRGHLQVIVNFARAAQGTESAGTLNAAAFQSWLRAFSEAAALAGVKAEPDINAALRVPGMLSSSAPQSSDESEGAGAVVPAVIEAIGLLNTFRDHEGAAICVEILTRCEAILNLVTRMEKIRVTATAAFQKRLRERLSELLRNAMVEPQRIVQEAAILADRSDVAEEMLRLRTHAGQLTLLLQDSAEKGKRLDFLLQEMNREANTILSKTSGLGDIGLTMTELALAAKSEIDKIREQSLNIE
jgi:uncharacterized protein (TIGR00255 family)